MKNARQIIDEQAKQLCQSRDRASIITTNLVCWKPRNRLAPPRTPYAERPRMRLDGRVWTNEHFATLPTLPCLRPRVLDDTECTKVPARLLWPACRQFDSAPGHLIRKLKGFWTANARAHKGWHLFLPADYSGRPAKRTRSLLIIYV